MAQWLADSEEWTPISSFNYSGDGFELLRASATPQTIDVWKSRRQELSSLGYSFVRERDGTLAFHRWKLITESELHKLRALSFATSSEFKAPSPAGLNFFPYQRAGIEFAWKQKQVLIGDEMGLGKTPQALGLLNLAAEREGLAFVLIVTLATLKIHWQREASRWLTFPHEIVIANGKPPTSVTGLFQSSKSKILIINIDLLPRWKERLFEVPWDVYVADEAHSIRNPKSARGEVGLSIQAPRKVFLTGTPIENNIAEFYNLIHALQPSRWSDFLSFAKRYCDSKLKEIPIKGSSRRRKVWDHSGSSNLDELHKKLRSTLMIRRLKDEVAKDLPVKTRQIIEIPGNTALFGDSLGIMRTCDNLSEMLQDAVKASKGVTDRTSFKSALAQIDDQIKILFEECAAVRKATGLAKIPMAIEHIRNLIQGGHKILVFAHHHEVLDEIFNEFSDQSVMIRGDVSTKNGDRQKAIDRFQEDKSCRLCVAGIRAAGTGLNLTAADVVVFLELDFIPGAIAQAEDRAHRHGQTSNVLVHYLVLEKSIDARMASILVEKMNLADASLDGVEPLENTPEVLPALTVAVGDGITSDILAREGALITAKMRKSIHAAIRHLTRFCDFGRSVDKLGFSVIDAPVGHDLAACRELTQRQAALGLRLLRRYHRQVPQNLLEAAEPALTIQKTDFQTTFDFPLELSA